MVMCIHLIVFVNTFYIWTKYQIHALFSIQIKQIYVFKYVFEPNPGANLDLNVALKSFKCSSLLSVFELCNYYKLIIVNVHVM